MHFSFFVTVFAVIFTLTECERNQNPSRKPSCGGKLAKGMITTIKQTKCNPRLTLQNLATDPDYEFDPPMVEVNRCVGHCMYSCAPKTFENVTRVVRRRRTDNIYESNWECVELEIQEHKSCGCVCLTQLKDCHSTQIYDGPNCRCICPNQIERKKECEKKMGMQWMEDICDCKCMILHWECTSGHMWDHMMCECVPNRK